MEDSPKYREQVFGRMLEEAADELQAIGLPRNFILDLLEEDDWGFVLKLHATIDAALSKNLLDLRLGAHPFVAAPKKDKIEKLVQSLAFDGRASKLAMAEGLGVLANESVRYLQALNQLRNWYAHDVGNHSLSMQNLIQKKVEATAAAAFTLKLSRVPSYQEIWNDMTPEQLRFVVSLAGMMTLWELAFHKKPKSLSTALMDAGSG